MKKAGVKMEKISALLIFIIEIQILIMNATTWHTSTEEWSILQDSGDKTTKLWVYPDISRGRESRSVSEMDRGPGSHVLFIVRSCALGDTLINYEKQGDGGDNGATSRGPQCSHYPSKNSSDPIAALCFSLHIPAGGSRLVYLQQTFISSFENA